MRHLAPISIAVGLLCCAGVFSCGGGESEELFEGNGPGSDIACQSDKECTPHGLLCDRALGKCVEPGGTGGTGASSGSGGAAQGGSGGQVGGSGGSSGAGGATMTGGAAGATGGAGGSGASGSGGSCVGFCSGKACGQDDGCGQPCPSGPCPNPDDTCVDGACECANQQCGSACCSVGQVCGPLGLACCQPDCSGRECGLDATCYSECGPGCSSTQTCTPDGTCVTAGNWVPCTHAVQGQASCTEICSSHGKSCGTNCGTSDAVRGYKTEERCVNDDMVSITTTACNFSDPGWAGAWLRCCCF